MMQQSHNSWQSKRLQVVPRLLGPLPGVLLVLIMVIALPVQAQNIIDSLSQKEAQQIGQAIFFNECGGDTACLLTWNRGEPFLSLGIGHFIWYPAAREKAFVESFPALMEDMRSRMHIPAWLDSLDYCPWPNRLAFQQALGTPIVDSLRSFLIDTIPLQAEFMVKRMKTVLERMRASGVDSLAKVTHNFNRLAASPPGRLVLTDYLNFKGDGLDERERYAGLGWGLLQVLQKMPVDEPPLTAFGSAAENVLRQRVANAPPERHEARWLRGWLRRVKSYPAAVITTESSDEINIR